MRGAPRSIFYGDPVEVTSEDVASALNADAAPSEVVDAAVAGDRPIDEGAQRIAAYDALPPTDKAGVTVVSPLAVANASVIVKPVTRGLSSSNLNYLLQKALVDYPMIGFVKTAVGVEGGETIINFNGSDLRSASDPTAYPGFHTIPFLRFNISASTLNARPGGNYNIFMRFATPETPALRVTTLPYTVQRINSTEAIVGIFIPFDVIATRTLPALGLFGQTTADDEVSCDFVVTGMQSEEILTATAPGYTTDELRVISELYSLPAGLVF